MAKIAFLDHNQAETDRPRRFEKRSVGQSLVRRALAYWVVRNVLAKMHPPVTRQSPVISANLPALHPNYIPATLPPAEVFGITFADPVKRPGSLLGFTRCWANNQERD